MTNGKQGLTVPKWVLMNWPILQMTTIYLSSLSSPKVREFDETRLHWGSVIRGVFNADDWQEVPVENLEDFSPLERLGHLPSLRYDLRAE